MYYVFIAIAISIMAGMLTYLAFRLSKVVDDQEALSAIVVFLLDHPKEFKRVWEGIYQVEEEDEHD